MSGVREAVERRRDGSKRAPRPFIKQPYPVAWPGRKDGGPIPEVAHEESAGFKMAPNIAQTVSNIFVFDEIAHDGEHHDRRIYLASQIKGPRIGTEQLRAPVMRQRI